MKRIVLFLLMFVWIIEQLCFALPARPPDFKQTDPRWRDMVYSSHGDTSQLLKDHGCGVCAVADMIAYWFDDSITPVEIAELSMRIGTCGYNSGTSRLFYNAITEHYPFSRFVETSHIDTAIECLESGGLVIVSFKSGVWNPNKSKRHSCLLYSYSKYDGFRLNDPGWPDGLMSKIIGHGSYEEVAEHAERYWCYWGAYESN